MTPIIQTLDKRTGRRKLWCIVGPFWPVMLFVTCPLILGIGLLVGFYTLHQVHIAVTVLFFAHLTFTMAALLVIACSDPGLVTRSKERGDRVPWFDDVCETYRPQGAHYCNISRVVVQDIDHVCPWTGTVIARKNMRRFKVFVSSVFSLLFFAVCLAIYGFSA